MYVICIYQAKRKKEQKKEQEKVDISFFYLNERETQREKHALCAFFLFLDYYSLTIL
jgi:hypothetical protein